MKKISINQNWKYRADFNKAYLKKDFNDKSWDTVCLPHTNTELPLNSFDEKLYQFVSTYRKTIRYTASFKDARVILHFEAVMISCEIWINGKKAASHHGGYTPFKIELTEYLKAKEDLHIAVMVDSTERSDIPPHGNVVDYLTFGGIYREAYLSIHKNIIIENIHIIPQGLLTTKTTAMIDLYIDSAAKTEGPASVTINLKDKNKTIAKASSDIIFGKGKSTERIALDIPDDIILWTIDDPYLYNFEISIKNKGDVESHESAYGFRKAEFRNDGFYLNGDKIKLIGLNRHQSFPYQGYAMPWRAQHKDADIIKNDFSCNIVRSSHYPASKHFLERCDQIGLLVFEEIPGWQHIGDEKWKEESIRDVKEMITRDWNHASVIIWGVRINESPDDHDFYVRTNDTARKLDTERPTGGVRNFEKSELIEDVYTFNDFIHDGTGLALESRKTIAKKEVPYLVTEHNGHMFPTKRFDSEERSTEHALRHLDVINAVMNHDDISGAIGWCAFDYNTHKDFGSSDQICYHGVADIFRIPKYAAAAYSSQIDVETKPVLEIASLMAKGERSAARIFPVYIFTNCDSLKIYKEKKFIGEFFPTDEAYKSLLHPPVILKELIGNQIEEYNFSQKHGERIREILSAIMIEGKKALNLKRKLFMFFILKKYKMTMKDAENLFKNLCADWGQKDKSYTFKGIYKGKEVITKTAGPSYAVKLKAEADDTLLSSEDWDTTRIVFSCVDEFDNISPFINDYIEFSITGPGEIIGPKQTGLPGGVSGAWVKTTGKKGTIKVSAKTSRFESDEILIKVK
ncbi:MAG: glycoside hydrolase family 2 protein [Spirochaetaceae bacterium]|jgi:beta-galactosidase|nr:glycoside hydrolase family 2 protein [Spirochaetaceae bacterium]